MPPLATLAPAAAAPFLPAPAANAAPALPPTAPAAPPAAAFLPNAAPFLNPAAPAPDCQTEVVNLLHLLFETQFSPLAKPPFLKAPPAAPPAAAAPPALPNAKPWALPKVAT